MKTDEISNNIWIRPPKTSSTVCFEIWLGLLSEKKLVSPHCEYRLLQYALLLMDCRDCTSDLTDIPKERPWTGNYGTSLLGFLNLLISPLLVLEPTTIFRPRSEQQPAGNWRYSRSIKLIVYCSLDTLYSCLIAHCGLEYYHMYHVVRSWIEFDGILFSQ